MKNTQYMKCKYVISMRLVFIFHKKQKVDHVPHDGQNERNIYVSNRTPFLFTSSHILSHVPGWFFFPSTPLGWDYLYWRSLFNLSDLVTLEKHLFINTQELDSLSFSILFLTFLFLCCAIQQMCKLMVKNSMMSWVCSNVVVGEAKKMLFARNGNRRPVVPR